MEFSIERSALLDALNVTRGAVERRTTLPILSHVLIETRGGTAQISATDLTIYIRTSRPAKVKREGALAVPGAKLRALVVALDEGPVVIKESNGSIEVRSGRSKTKLSILPASEYPVFPAEEGKVSFSIEPDALRQAIDRCAFAAGDGKDGRRFLASILVRPVEGGVRFVATDSHRLSQVDARTEGSLAEDALLPPRGFAELRELLGEDPVAFRTGGRFVAAVTSGVEVAMRPVDEEFPKFERLIPETHAGNLAFDRERLLAAVRRVSVAEDETRHINFELAGGMVKLCAKGATEESVEEIEAPGTDHATSLGFNSRYLAEFLSVVPEGSTVELGITNDTAPAIFKIKGDDSFLHMLMPMKPRS